MAGPREVISSAQAALFLIPPGGGAAQLLGIVEDFSAENNYQSEQLKGLGNFLPVDGVVNGAMGTFRYGAVADLDPAKHNILVPDPARFSEWGPFDVLCIDPLDNKEIARLEKCLPTNNGLTMTDGRALRQNYSGVCAYVRKGEEARRG